MPRNAVLSTLEVHTLKHNTSKIVAHLLLYQAEIGAP